VTLSRPQINALRYVRGRALYATDVNEGDGNVKRSILWLLDHGLLGWDPIYHGRVVLTEAGTQALAAVREIERVEKAKLGVMDLSKKREIQAAGREAQRKLRAVVKEAKPCPS
jgi:hypothetical protein